ncbi:hypothetical protein DesLBE_4843 [Desulfitobacterium sp. LBE]|nr:MULTISPECIES: hypothetical protein [Desulfitobacterium]EHL06354.1 hypothetical protein HMPREF0322_02922 [Desulfitobacterium hafniense DP7]KTE90170.1 hypothetical protein AT727_09590 [Desulfitobacterium hafniense]MEA5024776.1 hypothetical protein [Desulfitobacterium hafniense]TWH60406.1 hypothetical protein DesLBE_4843 [Desulfitobacterium sp. LBE]CDX02738.1 Hypothetical protein DPCES_2851 [Desulfitobacterium hafniense]
MKNIPFPKKIILVMGVIIILSLSLFYIENYNIKTSNGIDPTLVNPRFISAIGLKDPATFEPKVLRNEESINKFILSMYQLKEIQNPIPEEQLTGDIKKIVLHREHSLLKASGDHTMFIFIDLGVILFADKQYEVSEEFVSLIEELEQNFTDGWW